MKAANLNFAGIGSYGSDFKLCIGVVKNNADPAQDGRLQVFIPSIDTKDYRVEDLPWAIYVTPYGGTTANFKVGREQKDVSGASSYGFWAVPKNGAQVLCGFLEGEPNMRFWLGCFYLPELNRTLPQGINGIMTEIDESGVYPQAQMQHYVANLNEAGLGVGSQHFETRGGYERSISHPSNKNKNKPSDNGYAPKPLESDKSDSQTLCWTSPGRHYMVMSDVSDNCRIRIKSTEGNQVILDDTNERIYISTAQGRNWIELDETNGKIYFYTASKFNVHSENDLNLYSDQNINIVAKKRVNIVSEERGVKIQGKMGLSFISTAADVKITASRDLHLKTTNGDSASAVSESTSTVSPPYSGNGLGVIRDYAEDAGSGTSRIKINASDGVDIRADGDTVLVTASDTIELNSIGGDVTLEGSGNVNLKGSTLTTAFGSVGYVAIDGEEGPIPVKSLGNFAGAGNTADQADAVSSEDVTGKMIIPEHESWTRDEDESILKTPRNKSYKG
jgi:hypothetical protein